MFAIRSDAYALVGFAKSGLDARKLSADSAILLVKVEANSPDALWENVVSNMELSGMISSDVVYPIKWWFVVRLKQSEEGSFNLLVIHKDLLLIMQ